MQLSPEAKAGVTILLSVILLATMAMAVGRIDFGRNDYAQITLEYQSIDGLVEGAPVRYAGVSVGHVAAVQLASNSVLVNIRLDRDLIIPSDSQFVIATSGILGDKYIEIKPGQAQDVLDTSGVIAGVNPVSIDSMLHEVESAIKHLNLVISGVVDIAASEDLQQNMAEAGLLLKDTVASLKTAVDQVTHVAMSVQTVVDDVAVLSKQVPELDLRGTFDDINKFSQQLGNLNIVDPINELNDFIVQLNEVPVAQLAQDVQIITAKLAEFDLLAIEQDLRSFTSMLAKVEITPLVNEIMLVTEQIKSLELDQRGKEIAQFTAGLGALPLTEIATDLQLVAHNLTQVPIEGIVDNIYGLSVTLAELPINEMVSDLQVVTQELKDFGWQDMSSQLAGFTNQLADFDLDSMLAGVTDDLKLFSHTLASLQIDTLLVSVNDVVENLKDVSTAVDPGSITNIVADLEDISSNVRIATEEINTMVSQLNVDLQTFSSESLLALTDIQKIVSGVEESVDHITVFIADVAADGDTASNLKSSLSNIEASTSELSRLLEMVTLDLDSGSGVFGGLQDTMTSIQKLNEDIEKVKTMGEMVEIKSNWSAHLNLSEPRLMANIGFEFWPEDSKSFLLIGMSDILGEDGTRLQLQYGRQDGIIRHRYGIVDTSLGIGLDGQIKDKWGITAELKNLTSGMPRLSLGANYTWTPGWVIGVSVQDVIQRDGFSLGIERKF